MQGLVLFIVFVAFLAVPAYGQTQARNSADLRNELRELEKKLGQEIFKPLSVPAYVGIGKADLKTHSLQQAMDLAWLRARGDIGQEICDPERKLRGVRSFLFPPVSFTSDRVERMIVGKTLWQRLWLPKDKVDIYIDLICINRPPADKPAL